MFVEDARTRDVVVGMTAAEGLTWTAIWNRISLLSERRLLIGQGRLWGQAVADSTTSPPLPHLHGDPVTQWDPTGPAEATEWFYVAARHLLGHTLDGTASSEPNAVWHELSDLRAANRADVRARIGTVIALENLHRGVPVPASGNDNAHYFDDMSLVRAVAAALLHPGAPAAAADAADEDARVTHSLDGVWCARAVAALLSCVLGGTPADEATRVAVRELPEESWSLAVVTDHLAVAAESVGPYDLAEQLNRTQTDQIYSYPVIAPETLGALLAHFVSTRSANELLLGVMLQPRQQGVLVPVAGALAAAAYGGGWIPRRLSTTPVLAGASIKALAGASLSTLISDIDTKTGTAE